jgi:hypothetical protein
MAMVFKMCLLGDLQEKGITAMVLSSNRAGSISNYRGLNPRLGGRNIKRFPEKKSAVP